MQPYVTRATATVALRGAWAAARRAMPRMAPLKAQAHREAVRAPVGSIEAFNPLAGCLRASRTRETSRCYWTSMHLEYAVAAYVNPAEMFLTTWRHVVPLEIV